MVTEGPVFCSLHTDGPPAPRPHAGHSSASVVLPVILCIVAIIILAILIKKWLSHEKRHIEKADFDFRDEDSRSISSVDIQVGHGCLLCRIFGTCSRKRECMPLLANFGVGKHTSSDLYTELL